jgi:hypothetical protein
MNQRMKMGCAGAWRGLGAKPAQIALLHEYVCPVPAQKDATGPACNSAGNIQEPQNRPFEPISIDRYMPLCKSRPSMKPNSKPCGASATTFTLRPVPWDQRDSASGMIAETDPFPNRNAVPNPGAQLLDSEVERKQRLKIARMDGQRRIGSPPDGNGCEITWPTAAFCQILNPHRYLLPNRIDNHIL